jgi:hypothetical protein
LALPLATSTFFGSSVNSSPKGSAVWTGAAGGGAAAAGGAAGLGEGDGEAPASGAGLAAGTGEALTAGAEGAGEGLAETAGDGLGDWASALESKAADKPSEMAAAGISAAKVQRKRRFILFSPRPIRRPEQRHSKAPSGVFAARIPGSRETSPSNMRRPNSSRDRCVMGASAK